MYIRLLRQQIQKQVKAGKSILLLGPRQVGKTTLCQQMGFDLELAALQSWQISNFSVISKDLGPTIPTIQNYYQILEDTLFVERIDPYLKSGSRKKLTKSSRYLFFDLGVARILSQEGTRLIPERKGQIFENWIRIEIVKWIRLHQRSAKLFFWRDSDGPEIDWLIQFDGRLLPIEVKLSESPKESHTKHLKVFLSEYPQAKKGLVICTTSETYQLGQKIDVISYKNLHGYLEKWTTA